MQSNLSRTRNPTPPHASASVVATPTTVVITRSCDADGLAVRRGL